MQNTLTENGVLKVCPSFSLGEASKNRVCVRVNGEFKILQCSATVFKRILSVINEGKTVSDTICELEQIYPKDGVVTFLQVLLDSGILTISTENKANSEAKKINISILGQNKLLPFLLKSFDMTEGFKFIYFKNTENSLESLNGADFSIWLGESENLKSLLSWNNAQFKCNIPYLPIYFDGNFINIGPIVIPGATPCISCQMITHLEHLNSNAPVRLHASLADFDAARIAFPISEDVPANKLASISDMVMENIRCFFDRAGIPPLLNAKILMASTFPYSTKEMVYRRKTICEACQAYRNSGKSSRFELSKNYSELMECPVVYCQGGFRSVKGEEAESIIKKSLSDLSIQIAVEPLKASPFFDVLPIYKASLRGEWNKDKHTLFNRTSYGKGITKKQAYLSAAYELFDILSASFYGNEEIITSSWRSIKSDAIDLPQIANSIIKNQTMFEPFNPDIPIDWVWGKSLISKQMKLIPAFMVFLDYVRFRGQFFSSTSSGLSAGAHIEDAILQGLYEIIEHDAWMIGQANQVILPKIDISSLNHIELNEKIQEVQSKGYQVIFRDYSNDLGFPAVRCWIVNPLDYSYYAVSGFGASPSVLIACERAFTEAIQSSDTLSKYSDESSEVSEVHHVVKSVSSLYSLPYFKWKDIDGESVNKHALVSLDFKGKSVHQLIEMTVEQIKSRIPNADVLYVNLSRKELGVPAVRVLVSGDIQRLNYPLLSISPRMYSFTSIMGYDKKTVNYDNLYLGSYPH